MKKLIFIVLAGFIAFTGYAEKKHISSRFLSPYTGTYLPEAYINELNVHKSHVKASAEFRKNHEFSPNVIVLNENGMECNYNFHEGETLALVKNSRSSVTVKTYNGTEVCSLKDNQYLQFGNVRYVKVDEEKTMKDETVSKFLVKHLLSQDSLKEEYCPFFVKDDKVYYKGTEYNYGVSLVFTGHEFDQLVSTDSSDTKYIEVMNDHVNIFNGYAQVMEEVAEYEMESSMMM